MSPNQLLLMKAMADWRDMSPRAVRMREYARQRMREIRHPKPLTMAELIEELGHVWGTDKPVNIARRLGYENPHSLTRRLYRYGHHDLAAMLDRAIRNAMQD